MKELLYKETGISAKCFIKITNSVGVTFGEQELQIYMGVENRPAQPPAFKPAKEDDNFNGFHLHKIQQAEPLSDKFIYENDIIDFIVDKELHREIIQVIFNPKTNLNI